MVEAKLCTDKTQARRLIIQGAVKLDGNVVNELGATIDKGKEYIIQVGSRITAWFTYL
jgi:ribosomal protein S4